MTERRLNSRRDARRYVLNVTSSMLENEFNWPDFHEGWMFGGIENDEDRKLLAQEIRILVAELLAKARRT